MTVPVAAASVALASIVTNRILAVGIGLWLQVPLGLMFGILLFLDVVQIPFFYRLYDHGFSFFNRAPSFKSYLNRDWSNSRLGKWMMPLGGPGVMLVSAMPTFGGGIWLAAFFARALHMDRREGYAWILLGSMLSYGTLYWILDALIRTVRFFIQ